MGALTVLTRLGSDTSPRNLTIFLWLDQEELYGPDIWMIYKDLCGESMERFKEFMHEHIEAGTTDKIKGMLHAA